MKYICTLLDDASIQGFIFFCLNVFEKKISKDIFSMYIFVKCGTPPLPPHLTLWGHNLNQLKFHFLKMLPNKFQLSGQMALGKNMILCVRFS